ncbi:MAG: thioredoxin family protein [Candidatus Verstraetearchaeota archaeon]|jgi:small redox-active disulfide protein 2|nr:thioredoxin family protein [Candidatus Verstraetearchaeota archaeon]
MSVIKIFGSDPPCARCRATEKIVKEVVKELNLNVDVKHISVFSEEADKYGITTTPAVVINDKIVFSGRVPTKEEIKDIILRELKS